MKNICRELIYFDSKFQGKEYFSGVRSPVDFEQRKEYLKTYSQYLQSSYGLTSQPKKVVEEEELKRLVDNYALTERQNENVLRFTEMDAYSRKNHSPYVGWNFYTFGVNVVDDVICFKDGPTPPTPAVKYDFDGSERLSEIDFSFFVEKFETLTARATVTNVKGRMFELRCGMHTAVKLQLLANGKLYYLDGSNSKTHPRLIFICKCKENEWNHIKLRLGESSCDVVTDSEEKGLVLPIYLKTNPDNLFVSSGMFPLGDWKLRIDAMRIGEQTIEQFFIPNNATESECFLGSVKLPYAIGTFANRDNALIFRKTFDIPLKKHAKLVVKSIDPCGLVYLNGKCILQANTFLGCNLEISQYLKEKDNLLEIVVLPRAPEVFYQWHRHSDPYNGWFFNGVYIEGYDDNYVEDICVVTDKIETQGVYATINASLQGQGCVDIYVRKVYPNIGDEIKVDSFAYIGDTDFSKQYLLNVALWDTENPAVYEVVFKLNDGFEKSIETGFRIIEQKDGEIRLNGKRIFLNGALSMQFLPPYDETPINHLCPSDEQIVMQLEQVKRMSGNTLRMHFLGYGSNDERWARYADRAGIMLIWTTRLLDSLESVLMNNEWAAADAYAQQVKEVRQYPSIIMWEGSNEAKGEFEQVDKMFDEFVRTVKSLDSTRLLCPCSHLYYGGGLYDNPSDNGKYYQDDGLFDQDMQPRESSYGWVDKDVVRSAHTYEILLGYGCDWEWFSNQRWQAQQAMLQSKAHAYIVSEYAVIGRMCPNTDEAQEYFNPRSYELGDEFSALGGALGQDEHELSQAHQALCALYTNKKMRMLDVDGMLWCCLQGGANDGSYLKPILDFYGYAKYCYYILRDYYKKNYCALQCDGPFWNAESEIKPVLLAEAGRYKITVRVSDKNGVVCTKEYTAESQGWITPLAPCEFTFKETGYYEIEITTEELTEG